MLAPGSPSNDIDTGIHQGPVTIADTAQLASHSFAIDPETIRHTQKHYPLELDQPIFAWRDLPRWPDHEVFWGVDPQDHVTIFEATSGEVGFLAPDGLLLPLGDLVSPALRSGMLGGDRWARSEEPWAAVALAGAPLAVALDAAGTELRGGAFPAPGSEGLLARSDTSLPALALAQAPATTGFRVVYARSMDGAPHGADLPCSGRAGPSPSARWHPRPGPTSALRAAARPSAQPVTPRRASRLAHTPLRAGGPRRWA